MRSPSAFDRFLIVPVWILTVSLTMSAVAAAANDKLACSNAYDQTQAARRAGKLAVARQQAASCTRDACAAFIRTDCVKWLSEIDASQPTVVFDVKDTNGKDATAVRVTLDGNPWLDHLEGKALMIDPGEHKIRYELDGSSAHQETVQIREGEKNRKLGFSFHAQSMDSSTLPVHEILPIVDKVAKPSILPWMVGGVGVAGLAVGGIFGGLTLAAKSTADLGCRSTTKTCTSDGHLAAENGKTFGFVSTLGFVLGGIGVGTSALLLLMRKPTHSTAPSALTIRMGPTATPIGASWRIEGSF